MKITGWIALGCVTLVAGGTLASVAGAGDDGSGGGFGKRAHMRRFLEARRDRRGKVAKFIESLQITDAQRQLMLDKARAAEPIAAEARKELARILVAAQDAGKTGDPAEARRAAHEKVRGLKEATLAKLEPLAKEIVASLSPDQRKKFEEAAARHGRTFDEARLVKRLSRWLTRPMTVPMLEARLATR